MKKEDIREFDFGDFHFNYPLRILAYNGVKEVDERKLSPKEAHLLRMFCPV